MHIPEKVIKDIINLPRYSKRIIAIILDIGICILCTWIAFYLRLEQIIKISDTSILSVLISICLAIPIFWLLGLYKSMFRFEGLLIVVTMAIATLLYGFFYFLIVQLKLN